MANAEQISEQEIDRFHNLVGESFLTSLQLKLQVKQVAELFNWKAALPGMTVFYTAKPLIKATPVEYYDTQPLFTFSEPDIKIPLWVSWGEEWIKSQAVRSRSATNATLDLVGVSLCFHVGNSRQQKTQILRAEWDNPNRRGRDAAQPHWHIDPNIIDLPSWGFEQSNQVKEGLQELSGLENERVSPGLNFWSLHRLHLGMAGWTHRQDHPKCWQHKLDLDIIAEWLRRVLAYCKTIVFGIDLAARSDLRRGADISMAGGGRE
jgi:hypothetical protein